MTPRFSKDALGTGYAQATLRYLTILEPDLVMPQLLERAYGGLESINETHRTTAAIGTLASVSSALTRRAIWPKGQRHLVPLLELCLPGIDINDSVKTVSTCMFIVSALQFIKIGDLNVDGVVPLAHDTPAEDVIMKVEGAETSMLEKKATAQMSEEDLEEEEAVRHSTAGFAGTAASAAFMSVASADRGTQIGLLVSSAGYLLSTKTFLRKAANPERRAARLKVRKAHSDVAECT